MRSDQIETPISGESIGPSIGVNQDFPATFRWRLLSAYAAIAVLGVYLLGN